MALPALSMLSLRDVYLDFYHQDPFFQCFSPPSALLPSAPSTDHVGLALHSLSQSLFSRTLDSIVISSDVYWPVDSSAPPVWSNMRKFNVGFNMTAPNRVWYFVRDPSKPNDKDEGANDTDHPDDEPETESDSYSDSDSFFDSSSVFRPDTFNEKREARAARDYPIRSFRALPSETHIKPLLVAMARAAARMPKLQEMSLTSTMPSCDEAGFQLQFYAAKQASLLDSEPGDSDKARLYRYKAPWRPDDDILRVWREGRDGSLVRCIE
ncbi:MAG: hypothetical protein Q9173_004139 [Seirophora scorigena]